MFTLSSIMQGNCEYECCWLFKEHLEDKMDAAYETLIAGIKELTPGKEEEFKLDEIFQEYDYLSNQFYFESGMRLGAQLALALLKGGTVE